MKILVYTITFNRIDLTKKYLNSLREHTKIEYDHVVFDNGSTDGTVEWLKENGYRVIENKENLGITRAEVEGLIAWNYGDYNLIIKFDNDCEVTTNEILEKVCEFYRKEENKKYIIAPFDLNIDPAYQPYILEDNDELEITGHNSGMFRVVPRQAMVDYIFVNGIEKDLFRCRFWNLLGYKTAYKKGLFIKHQGLGNSTENYKF